MLSFVVLLGLTSCSKDLATTSSSLNPNMVVSPALSSFLQSLDSLKGVRSSLSSVSRVQCFESEKDDQVEPDCNIGSKLADQVGRYAGGYGGKWVGGLIGMATGNA